MRKAVVLLHPEVGDISSSYVPTTAGRGTGAFTIGRKQANISRRMSHNGFFSSHIHFVYQQSRSRFRTRSHQSMGYSGTALVSGDVHYACVHCEKRNCGVSYPCLHCGATHPSPLCCFPHEARKQPYSPITQINASATSRNRPRSPRNLIDLRTQKPPCSNDPSCRVYVIRAPKASPTPTR